MKVQVALALVAVLLIGAEGRRERLEKLSSNSRFSRQVDHRNYIHPQAAVHQQHQFREQRQQPVNVFQQQPQQQAQPQPINVQPEAKVDPQPGTARFNTLGVKPIRPVVDGQEAQRLQSSIFNQVLNQQKNSNAQLIGFRQVPSTVGAYQQGATGGYQQAAVGGYQQPAVGAYQQATSGGYQRETTGLGASAGSYGSAGTASNQQTQGGKILLRLIDNATLIRENIVDGFTCTGKIYGYYADINNDCQIFHICYPVKDVFKNDPAVHHLIDVTYEFSFICPKYTIFDQYSLTCAWKYEAVPCSEAVALYTRNEEFFKEDQPSSTNTGGVQTGGGYGTV